ncbi:hypothetical protein TREES_T100003995 [Tupaia chinensis]|uniref:Uncharacterized protein n=1 Tax=Tupaia chinensis TaxID=246437 RepID=L9KX74_TUPCH|nr:hypothetical protein TREES_T100003995 [Tupaia chinensis]
MVSPRQDRNSSQTCNKRVETVGDEATVTATPGTPSRNQGAHQRRREVATPGEVASPPTAARTREHALLEEGENGSLALPGDLTCQGQKHHAAETRPAGCAESAENRPEQSRLPASPRGARAAGRGGYGLPAPRVGNAAGVATLRSLGSSQTPGLAWGVSGVRVSN